MGKFTKKISWVTDLVTELVFKSLSLQTKPWRFFLSKQISIISDFFVSSAQPMNIQIKFKPKFDWSLVMAQTHLARICNKHVSLLT